jgi:hypothetical protein
LIGNLQAAVAHVTCDMNDLLLTAAEAWSPDKGRCRTRRISRG